MSQQFVVPQFIDVESKIFGPITVRQFVTILVALFLEFIIYKLSDFTLFLVLSAVVIPAAGAMAFMKIGGIPFPNFLLNFIQSFQKPRIRVWDKSLSDAEMKQYLKKPIAIEKISIVKKEMLASSRLAELSLIIDTGGMYKGESNEAKSL
ncbi:MAG: PrgI family protein [bacterium]